MHAPAIFLVLLGLLLVSQTFANSLAPIPGYGVEEFSWNLEVTPGSRMVFNGTIEEAIGQATQVNPKWKRDFKVMSNADIKDTSLNKRHYTNWGDGPVCNPPNGFNWEGADYNRVEEGINYLYEITTGEKPNAGPGPGSCGRVSCSYKAAIWWCNDNHIAWQLTGFSDIADAATLIFNKCPDHRGDSGQQWTLRGQMFTLDNWNVIVRYDNC